MNDKSFQSLQVDLALHGTLNPNKKDEIKTLNADILKRIEDCLPENPYPESVFPMTDDEYVKAIPDPHMRSAISGYVGRFVFKATIRRFLNAIKDEFEE